MSQPTESEVKQIKSGELLNSLRQSAGWKEAVKSVILPMYDSAWIMLEDKEDMEARATLKVIRDLVEKIDDSVNLSESLRKEYREKLNQTGDTP